MFSEHNIEIQKMTRECERFEDEFGDVWLVEKEPDGLFLHKQGHDNSRIHYWEGMDLLLGLHQLH